MPLIIGLAILFSTLLLGGQEPARPSQSPRELVVLTAGQQRAKLELNEAAESYRKNEFSEARRHVETAQEYDPQNKTARLFLARIIHRQYLLGDQSPENVARALSAIEAYKRILADDAQSEEAYKAIASLYGKIGEDEEQRQWILQRALDPTVSPEKRSEAYVVLASKDWHCSNMVTDSPANKETEVRKNRAVVRYHKPKNDAEFQQAKACLENGLSEIEISINLSPESETAWSYKTNLLLEASKLAEMEGQTDLRAELKQRANEAQRRTDELSHKQKQNTEADNSIGNADPPKAKRP